MNNEERIAYHKELLDELHKLYKTKNSDYGNSVGLTYEIFGISSFLTRINDKTNRLNSLYLKKINGEKASVGDEKFIDTLLDLSNYCLLALIELKNDELKKRKQEGINCL